MRSIARSRQAASAKRPPASVSKSAAKPPERSHAMESMLRQAAHIAQGGPTSPVALAQRVAFMNHCLCCNIICKSCFPDEGGVAGPKGGGTPNPNSLMNSLKRGPVANSVSGVRKGSAAPAKKSE